MWKDIECIVVDFNVKGYRKTYKTHIFGLWKAGIMRAISHTRCRTIKEAIENAYAVLETKGYKIVKDAVWSSLLEA
jgi:hypothetical protein